MPRTKKAAGTAVDPRNGRRAELSVVKGERLEAPDGLSPQALEVWDAYWDDPVASVQTPADRAVLRRWITEYDRYLRLSAEADKAPVVHGSMGQPVPSPLYAIAYQALGAVEKCERQMGMGARNRSELGLAVISEAKSLSDMNAKYGGGHADGDHPARVERKDPRVVEG